MQPECSCMEGRCREENSRSGRGQTLENGGEKGEQRSETKKRNAGSEKQRRSHLSAVRQIHTLYSVHATPSAMCLVPHSFILQIHIFTKYVRRKLVVDLGDAISKIASTTELLFLDT